VKREFRRRFGSAHVIALVALFVALGGTTWAATHLGKNSVKAKNIKKNAVTTKKIKDGAVVESKLGPDAQVASIKVDKTGNLTVGTPGTSVVRKSLGVYCVGLPFSATGGSVTLDQSNPSFPLAYLQVPQDAGCDSAHQDAAVFTYLGGLSSDEAFYAVFR
jgi:hypothetical protein